jgi:hypothetical protein
LSGGVHYWYNAPSGTAGNAISFTQAMTLNASGRLLLGTTSDDGGSRLQVNGKISAGGASESLNGLSAVNNSAGQATIYSYNYNASGYSIYSAQGINYFANNVGIGTTSPNAKLNISGTGDLSYIYNSGASSTDANFYVYSATKDHFMIRNSGNVGIGTASPARNLTVSTSTDTYISALGSTTSEVGVLFGDSGNDAIGRILYVNAGDFMQFYTNNSERMRITSAGELLINTTSNSATSNVGSKFVSNGRLFTVSSYSDNTQESLSMYSTTASAYRFYVGWGGTVYATNTTISAISDIRYKENVRDLDSALNKLMLLKPRVFDWKEGMGKNIKNDKGFIAQEFEQIFPELVDKWKEKAPQGEEPYKSIRQDLIPYLVKAIQELKAEIETLKNK